jgi:cytidylate kinase
MYRAVTLYCLQNDHTPDDVQGDPAILGNIKIDFKYQPEHNFFVTCLNGQNVEMEIRGIEVSKSVSNYAALPAVRTFLLSTQQSMGKDKGVVMDGRDIGTVVFPDAELKIFMTAPPEVRAKRRYTELLEKGVNVTYDEVLNNINERDYIDSNREVAPLLKADDAITLDNTDMTREQQLQVALTWAKGVIAAI